MQVNKVTTYTLLVQIVILYVGNITIFLIYFINLYDWRQFEKCNKYIEDNILNI